MKGALVESQWRLVIVSPMEIGDWRLVNDTVGDMGEHSELPHWRFVNVTLAELGELGELPHWRLANVTPQCFVAGAQ